MLDTGLQRLLTSGYVGLQTGLHGAAGWIAWGLQPIAMHLRTVARAVCMGADGGERASVCAVRAQQEVRRVEDRRGHDIDDTGAPVGGGEGEEDVVQLVELYEAEVVRAAHPLDGREPQEQARPPRDQPREVAHASAVHVLAIDAPGVETADALCGEELLDQALDAMLQPQHLLRVRRG